MSSELTSEDGSVETAVRERYAAGATQQVPELCCAVSYDPALLEAIPDEVIERDYGCGDPTKFVRAGEAVLDLGSGGGKACFIAAQVVGVEGSVIGVDMTPEMLDLARRNAPAVARKLGYANVSFRRGRIQDLALDLDLLDQELRASSATGCDAGLRAEQTAARLRATHPMVASDSIDTVISNCVLNLVDAEARPAMFREIHRVLLPDGRALISDIVSDVPVPAHLREDPEKWSGCISGAMTEADFANAFAAADLGGLQLLEGGEQPWQTVEGIEFRSITVAAYKGQAGETVHAAARCGPDCC
ncbi:MAG: methyltransferase domain-containing protein [Thermoleophilia bacterium]|nr:methyltransferase domain-containing protein [Thermoleophilia bacterium]